MDLQTLHKKSITVNLNQRFGVASTATLSSFSCITHREQNFEVPQSSVPIFSPLTLWAPPRGFIYSHDINMIYV